MSGLSSALFTELETAQHIGAIGAAPIADHVRHALAFGQALDGLLPAEPLIVDLGSGSGLPGLVLAEAHPRARLVLLEGRAIRAAQLEERVERLELSDRVRVLPVRAEEAGQDPQWRFGFDAAVARGFAAPAVTAECAAPLLKDNGLLCVSEPPNSDVSGRWPKDGCATVGLEIERSMTEPNAFVVLRRVGSCPDRFPRRVGIPRKRPIF